MRVLGIDFGARRIGVALGDTEARLASPWEIISYDTAVEAIARIREIVALEGAELVVVGVPRPLWDASAENEQVRVILDFIRELQAAGFKVEQEDETLSSRLAARQVADRGEKGKRDDLAAAAILQTWLDRQS